MKQERYEKWDRLSRWSAAACLFLLFTVVWMCAAVKAGGGKPESGRKGAEIREEAGEAAKPNQEDKGEAEEPADIRQPEIFHQGFLSDMDGELYFYDKNGEMVKSRFVTIVDKTEEYRYYFCADGKAAKGLKKTRYGNFYYFNEYGLMLVSEIKTIGEKTYYFGEDGRADWILERFD